MSDPAQPPLEYQTLTTKAHWLRRNVGALALGCALMQFPWIMLSGFLTISLRGGRPVDLAIDTATYAFDLLPPISALSFGIWGLLRAKTTPLQRVLALIAILIAGIFLRLVVLTWWQWVVHAPPGRTWPVLSMP